MFNGRQNNDIEVFPIVIIKVTGIIFISALNVAKIGKPPQQHSTQNILSDLTLFSVK